ncbi:MAG: preprotein translocase subunit Sec61beta [Nanoarchaeota archaeon]
MADKISMPAGFGGLLRYSEEYKSKFMLKPSHVVALIIAIVLFVIVLNIFFPLA